MNIRSYFTEEQKADIKKAIIEAELNTSGEVRVHLEKKCKGEVMQRAVKIFEKLKMHKTEARNGVLIYLAVETKVFAIVGDKGINETVPEGFWSSVKEAMADHFRKEEMEDGLKTGIQMAGEKLKAYFPYQSDDINELDDDLSFGDQ
jgi:uncharacterized membrane protein